MTYSVAENVKQSATDLIDLKTDFTWFKANNLQQISRKAAT